MNEEMLKMISLLCVVFILSGCCHISPKLEEPETRIRIEFEYIGLLFELHIWNSGNIGTIILPGYESQKTRYVRINDHQINHLNQLLSEIFNGDLGKLYTSSKYSYADAPNTEIFYSRKSIRFIHDIGIPFEFIPLLKLISEIIKKNFSFGTKRIVNDFLRTDWEELFNAKMLEGKYYYSDILFGGEMHIKPNGTFVLDWSLHLLSGKTAGKWRIENDFLVLNSDKQPDDDELKYIANVFEKTDLETDVVTLKVVDETKTFLPGVRCEIITEQKVISAFSNNEGVCMFEKVTSISSLKIELAGFKTIEYVPQSQLTNNFEAVLEIETQSYLFFTNIRWIIGNEKLSLIDPSCGNDKPRDCIWRLLIE